MAQEVPQVARARPPPVAPEEEEEREEATAEDKEAAAPAARRLWKVCRQGFLLLLESQTVVSHP